MARPFPRAGAWALVGGRVGVIAAFPYIERTTTVVPDEEARRAGDPNATMNQIVETPRYDQAEIHYVDDKGVTAEVARAVPIGDLTQAKLDQIPDSRKAIPNEGESSEDFQRRMTSLGYL